MVAVDVRDSAKVREGLECWLVFLQPELSCLETIHEHVDNHCRFMSFKMWVWSGWGRKICCDSV